jgi:CheY-like chemotaxis protein
MTDGHGAVLVVEDDPDVREALSIFLESEGHQVVEAANGREALERLRGIGRCCLILLDLFMPEMDGWAFRREQLADPDLRSIPVLVISADRSAGSKATQLGAVGCLVKPLDFDDLLGQVSAHC